MKKRQTRWFDSAIMKEDESRTTATSKHFILNNGTRKAVFSPKNVNYYHETEKKWMAIDNTLTAVEDGYVAQLGNYTAKLSKQNDDETVEITDGASVISWKYLGTNKNVLGMRNIENTSQSAKRKSKLNVKNTMRDGLNLSHAGRAIFEDAEGSIDLDYLIEGNGIKENIIVKDKSESYRYYFLLRASGFWMKPSETGGDIEFYRTTSNLEFAESQTPAFIMPAPYMYDANGERSDAVHYDFEDLGDGNHVFSVEADPEWINAPERVFPICIDPQLLTVSDPYISVSHRKYQWQERCSGSCCEAEWVHVSNPGYDHINISNQNSEKTTAILSIKKLDIDPEENNLISAKLVFQKYDNENYQDSVDIKIGDLTQTHSNENELEFDITSAYKSSTDCFDLDVSLISSGSRKFNLPVLEIEYRPINSYAVRKTLSLEEGVGAELDILWGNATVMIDDITDPTLGVSVSHVYKPNDTIEEYGQNFRLNLDEKLEKMSSSTIGVEYVYTDALGDKHTFDEHFYCIDENGAKEYITSGLETIEADADGRLWLEDVEVFRELTTDRGLRASARLDGGVNNAEWVEQRIDEEKQLEEQIKSYKNTLCNFKFINKETEDTSMDEETEDTSMDEDTLDSPDSVESFLSNIDSKSHLLLSKEEALSYKSLLTQKASLSVSKEALELQNQSIEDTKTNMTVQYDAPTTFDYQSDANVVQFKSLNFEEKSIEYALEDYKEKVKDINNLTEEEQERIRYYNDQLALVRPNDSDPFTKRNLSTAEMTLILNQQAHWAAQQECAKQQINGTLTSQQTNIDKQVQIVQTQASDLQKQLDLYISKSIKYIEQFRSYYKEYLNLKNQLEKLKMQIPVAYLISDHAVKGFNEKGDLVVIQDKYGKYVVVEREKYNSSNATRISAVYDQDGHSMNFLYNGENQLSYVYNSIGERAFFQYSSSGYLTHVERANRPVLTLMYSTGEDTKRITRVRSANETFATLSYSPFGMLTNVTHYNKVKGIAHDNILSGSLEVMSDLEIAYTPTETKFIYDNIEREIYMVDAARSLVDAHYELVNGLVANAEYYTYDDNHMLYQTKRADKSCLNRHSFSDFSSNKVIETVETVNYDSFKSPSIVQRVRYAIPRTTGDSPIEQTETVYIYNDDHKLTQLRTMHSWCDCCSGADSNETVEKYYYNNAGDIVRKERYVVGEELKTGISIEEHVYNDKGVETQSFTYNSLDPSSKFYSENEVDEQGRTLAAFDESGEHKTTFDYESDGVTVKTERLPNGSKFSYGGTKDGTVTAITHSTENGEENSTTQTRTLGMVTQVKSGNNTVEYTYDNKRRLESISLNGVDDYVKYAYSGEHTDAETVTATMVGGTTATTVKNAHGNVTETTCGDRSVRNTYNTDQQLTKTVDSVSGETTLAYNDKGNVTTVTAPDHTETFAYDSVDNTLESKTITIGGVTQTYQYGYKLTADKSLDCIIVDGKTVRPNTDALGRNMGKVIEIDANKIAEEKIGYVKFGDHATNLPSTVRFATNGVFKESMQYRYDSMGNIAEIFENGRSACRYEYDALGRLTREDNVAFGKTTTWAYDNNGNIIARYESAITAKPTSELYLLDCICINYAYDDNSDQLLSYGDESFVYDTIGNPTTYRGKTAVWEYGRQLKSYDGNAFSYDARGRRTAKNGIAFTYDSNGNLIKQSNGLEFLYDHTGVFAVKHGEETYFYRKDAQANIVELLDNTGAVVVKYKYDAWGKCQTTVLDDTATEIAELNPFRYRSYYLDTETGFYFLKTRYYDSEIGRFMTIDDISYLDPESINGLNLYAYCGDNPIRYSDPNGTLVITGTALLVSALVGAAAGALVGGIYGGITAAANNQNVLAGVFIGLLAGGIMGAGAGIAATFIAPVIAGEGIFVMGSSLSIGAALAIGTTVAFGAGSLGGAISDILTQIVNNGGVSNWGSVGVSALQWGVLNTIGTYLSALGGPHLTNFENFVLSQVFNHLTSSLGLLVDMLRASFQEQKLAATAALY